MASTLLINEFERSWPGSTRKFILVFGTLEFTHADVYNWRETWVNNPQYIVDRATLNEVQRAKLHPYFCARLHDAMAFFFIEDMIMCKLMTNL